MAATVSAWNKPGAWALDAEENETELLQQRKEDDQSHGGEKADFPSLSAAATTKPKKKKAQTVSLQEFAAHGVAAQPKGLTPNELFALPTGPRERTAEELDRNKLGGGFRSYGGGSRDEQPRRQGSFNREPSRADETDDWGAGKKSTVNSGFDRRERGDSQSRADEVDNWGSNKSYVPSETRKYEKRGSFGSESGNGGSDSGNWGRRNAVEGRGETEGWERKREEVTGGTRPKLNLQPRTLPVNEEQTSEKPKGSSPFGNARPREEVLKEKGQDLKEIEEQTSEIVKAKEVEEIGNVVVKTDPFGNARPREEVLKEKHGQDWKEIEEKLQSVKIKEVVSAKEGFWRRPDSHPQSGGETEKGKEDAESCEDDGEGRDS